MTRPSHPASTILMGAAREKATMNPMPTGIWPKYSAGTNETGPAIRRQKSYDHFDLPESHNGAGSSRHMQIADALWRPLIFHIRTIFTN